MTTCESCANTRQGPVGHMCWVFRVTWEGSPDSSLGYYMSQIVYFCLQTNSLDRWGGTMSIAFCILGGG